MADEDLIITVDSLEEPFDTTQTEQPRRTDGPVRLKVPWKEDGKTARQVPERSTGGPTDDAVENLRGQLTAAQAREADANRRANEAAAAAHENARRVDQARTVIADTTATALDSEIASATTESTSLKAAFKAAFDAGDSEKMAELQEKIGDVRARLYDAKQRKARVEQGGEVSRPHQGAVRELEPRQLSPEEQRQKWLSQFSGASRAWLENHPDIYESKRRGTEAQLAHEIALEKGIKADTPEYFRFIEEQMGYTKVTRTTQKDNNVRRGEERIESAPVNRGGSGGSDISNGQPVQVTLTRGEVEAANTTVLWNPGPGVPKELIGKPIGAKEYARRKAIMKSQGFYDARDV